MRERPILMSGPLVLKSLAGLKTQTRRVIAGRGPDFHSRSQLLAVRGGVATFGDSLPDDPCPIEVKCPYGQPGDRLWVRETWNAPPGSTVRGDVSYRADFDAPGCTWRSPLFMPRWASRLTLAVESIRVERLQDISEEDARGEGVEPSEDEDLPWRCYRRECDRDGGCAGVSTARGSFTTLWDRINKKRPGCSCEANPWVWVISFRRLEPSHE